MQRKITKLNFKGQEIYVGLDTGKKSWKVSILTKDFEHKTFSQPPKPEVLVDYLRRNFPGAKYLCVYEAGYFGFWIHDALREQGVECLVTHPADVPTKDKERRNGGGTIKSKWNTFPDVMFHYRAASWFANRQPSSTLALGAEGPSMQELAQTLRSLQPCLGQALPRTSHKPLGSALYDRLFALGHDPGRRPQP